MKRGRLFKDYNNFGPSPKTMMSSQPPQIHNPRNQGRQFRNYNNFNNMNINSQFNQLSQPKTNYVNYNDFNMNFLNNDIIFKNTYEELRRKMNKIEGIKDKEKAV